jgi:hypothetical protein
MTACGPPGTMTDMILICEKHQFRHVDELFTCPFCSRESRTAAYAEQRAVAEANQEVRNSGLSPSDPRWSEALSMARSGTKAWRIAEWAGAERHVVLALQKLCPNVPLPTGVET